MLNYDWAEELSAAVTVCDAAGIIIYMNKKSVATFENDGGEMLIGQNLIDCHPEPSKSMVKKMLSEPFTNSYTIEKKGVKKLIHQTPWYKDGVFSGLVEFSIIIPENMPHFIRK